MLYSGLRRRIPIPRITAGLTVGLIVSAGVTACQPADEVQASPRRSVILIISDDHRYDFLGFMASAPEFLDTPNLDRMAREGAHLRNAFVTTSLCSPSRASILTGQYAHRHRIVDNTSPIPAGTRFFPQRLNEAGYQTAFIGKWHMGEDTDTPQPGFDYWLSFRGQGVYHDPELNVNGHRAKVLGYTTDILTDSAVAFLDRHRREAPGQPFFVILSHKAVHAEFQPAPRHLGRYATTPIPYPPTMANTGENYAGKPRWVREQRGSWHGVDHMYHGAMDFSSFYRGYAETLLAMDESVGRILDWVTASGQSESTLVLYLGDNGFMLGEHGLIDKRQAYEESMRIPMLAYAPGLIQPGAVIGQLVRNIDLAPTFLDLAGIEDTGGMDGRSLMPLLRAEETVWDTELLYEYFWEYSFPHTPTVFALRDSQFKYIFYYGLWDTNELYDLDADPQERINLIASPEHRDRVAAMKQRLWDLLERTGGGTIPLKRPGDWQAAERRGREDQDGRLDIRIQFDDHQTMTSPTQAQPQPLLSPKQFELVAKALADPRRMALLEAVGSEREYACSKLCQIFPLSKGTVSHHMKELINAGLIHSRREGQYMHFEIRREVLAAYTAELMRRVVRTE